ncbi:MAG: hypothetical protein Q8N39_10970 [Pelolinea sp.]|nr:hypothetical protein [Pelolinea sp.]
MLKARPVLILTALLLVISIACGVSFDSGGGGSGPSEVEQTLQAIYAQDTMQALASASNTQPTAQVAAPQASQEAPAATEITHTTIPGNPGSPDQTKDEIDTSNTAEDKIALGDSFRLGTLERPFTQDVMDYSKEVDLLEVTLAKDLDFYIFNLMLVGPNQEKGYPSAHYGIEFDTDRDGRGDILLWAKGNGISDWTIDDVMVLSDSNDDVGGSRPVLPDTNSGDGYDKVLFSLEKLDDPDAAWQRMDSTSNVQLAIKTSLVGGSRYFWRAWADSGLADPIKFDYNDSFSEEQAGSPNKNSKFYPVGQLNLMDSTCWIAFNFEPTGKDLGGCYQLQQPTPVPTKPTPNA